MAPHGNYRCRGDDSWIAVRSDAEWARLCSVMGSQELAYDDRFVNFPSRQLYADELDRIVTQWTSEMDAPAAMEHLQREGIPSALVSKMLEVFDNPQFRARGFFEEVNHPM